MEMKMRLIRRSVQEHAVSPVVGVMLMLVVTIIIAAVVSAFAGGMGADTKKAPQASIDVNIGYGDLGMGMSGYNVELKHLSGDPIPTRDLAIITYFTNKSGHTYRHEQTALSKVTKLYATASNAGRVPFLSDMRYGYAGGDGVSGTDFGNFTWKVGDIMCTNGDPGTADLLGINDSSDPHAIADTDFGPGSIVDVKVLHIPSSKYIFDKEVIVS
jgi:FlaG/FlaF family flagellin (archaellin)